MGASSSSTAAVYYSSPKPSKSSSRARSSHVLRSAFQTSSSGPVHRPEPSLAPRAVQESKLNPDPVAKAHHDPLSDGASAPHPVIITKKPEAKSTSPSSFTPLRCSATPLFRRREGVASPLAEFRLQPSHANPLCRLKLEEGPLCMDYHPAFQLLLVGSTKEMHYIKVDPAAAHGLGYGVSKSYPPRPTSSPPPLASIEKYKGLHKVEKVIWYPSHAEAIFAFVQSSSITILMDVLQVRHRGLGRAGSSEEGPLSTPTMDDSCPSHANSDFSTPPLSTFSALSLAAVGASLRVRPLGRNRRQKLRAVQGVGERFVGGGPVRPSLDAVTPILSAGDPYEPQISSLLRQTRPTTRQILELEVPTYSKIFDMAWDFHRPYTLAIATTNSYFELWEIPMEDIEPQEAVLPPPKPQRQQQLYGGKKKRKVSLCVIKKKNEMGDRGSVSAPPPISSSVATVAGFVAAEGDSQWQRVRAPRRVLRALPSDATSTRVTPQAISFSPSRPRWVAVMSDCGQNSDVRIFEYTEENEAQENPQMSVSVLLNIPISGHGVSISFHPVFQDLLAVVSRQARTKTSSTIEFWSLKPCSQDWAMTKEAEGTTDKLIVQRHTFPPIRSVACFSQLRWRPCEVLKTTLDVDQLLPSSSLSYLNLLRSQLWFVTSYTDFDSSVCVWDAGYSRSPICQLHCIPIQEDPPPPSHEQAKASNLHNRSKALASSRGRSADRRYSAAVPHLNKPTKKREIDPVALDVVWVDSLGLLMVFRSGEVVFGSLGSERLCDSTAEHKPSTLVQQPSPSRDLKSNASPEVAGFTSHTTLFSTLAHFPTATIQMRPFGRLVVQPGFATSSPMCRSTLQQLKTYYSEVLQYSAAKLLDLYTVSAAHASLSRFPLDSPASSIVCLTSQDEHAAESSLSSRGENNTEKPLSALEAVSSMLKTSTQTLSSPRFFCCESIHDIIFAPSKDFSAAALSSSSGNKIIHIPSTASPFCLGGSYKEQTKDRDSFAVFALEWDIGYDAALLFHRVKPQVDVSQSPLKDSSSLSFGGFREIQKMQERLSELNDAIDAYFVGRMKHNAAVFVRHREGETKGVGKSFSTASPNRRGELLLLSEAEQLALAQNESAARRINHEQQQDGRGNWWSAAAHAYQTHLPSLILTFVASQLEQASLLGDCQFCLTLYLLTCMWWKLRRVAVKLAWKYASGTSEDRLAYTDMKFDPYFDGSVSCPFLPTDVTPCDPQRDGKGSPKTSSHFSSPTSLAFFAPHKWRLRSLQWLDAYVGALHMEDLFVPINELYVVTQEVYGANFSVLQQLPLSSRRNYEKQGTYVFCVNCKENPSGLGVSSPTLHVPASPTTSVASNANVEAPPLVSCKSSIRKWYGYDPKVHGLRMDYCTAHWVPSHGEDKEGMYHSWRNSEDVGSAPSTNALRQTERAFFSFVEHPHQSSRSASSSASSSTHSSQGGDPQSPATTLSTPISSFFNPTSSSNESPRARQRQRRNKKNAEAYHDQRRRRHIDQHSVRANTKLRDGAIQELWITPTIPAVFSPFSLPAVRRALQHANTSGSSCGVTPVGSARLGSRQRRKDFLHGRSHADHDNSTSPLRRMSSLPYDKHSLMEMSMLRQKSIPNAFCRSCFQLNAMTCVICDALVEGIFIRFPMCHHGGHREHVKKWFEISDVCPVCGAPIHSQAAVQAEVVQQLAQKTRQLFYRSE